MKPFALLACWLLVLAASASPAATQQRLPSMQDVLQLRDIGGNRRTLALSPDGGAVAIVVRQMRLADNDYRHTLIVIDTRTGIARTLANTGGAIVSDDDGMLNGVLRDRVALWSENGAWLAYLNVNAAGHVELWRVRASGGAPRLVANGPGDVRRFAWRGQDLIFETSTPRALLRAEAEAEMRDGFRVDDRFDAMYALRPLPRLSRGAIWVWSAGRVRPALTEEARILDGPQSSAPRVESGRAAAAQAGDGARAWFEPLDREGHAAARAMAVYRERPGLAPERCEDAPCHGAVRQVFLGDAGQVYFLRTEGHARSETALYLWRAHDVRLLRRIEGVIQDCAASAAAIYCIEDAALQPRRIIRIEPDTGAARPLFDPNPGWARYELPRIERIDVRDRYGDASFAYLLYPADYHPGRVYPAVLVQYRARGFLRAGVGGEYPVYEFARRGFFVINFERPNLEHAPPGADQEAWQRETEMSNIEQRAKQSALEAVLSNLAARGDIDMRRIAMTGLSDGAETLYWALAHSDLFAAGVAGTPPTDPSVWPLTSADNRERLQRLGLGDGGAHADPSWRSWWANMNAAAQVDHIRAPLLLQLSDDEALTAFPFYAAMRAQHRAIEFFIYPDAHHVRTRPSQILAGQRRSADWITFWLQGICTPDLADPERCARWEALREASQR